MSSSDRTRASGVAAAAAIAAALTVTPAAVAASPGENGLIAFEAATTDGTQLFTIRPDGTGIRQITSVEPSPGADQPGASKPDWSPDGRTIVFVENDCQIALVDADGSDLREVPAEPGVCEINPTFGADGRSLIYGRSDPGTRRDETWTMDLDGTDRRLVSDACPFGGVASPDDTHLACMGPDGGLLVMGMDGTDAVPILLGRGFGPKFDWAPDGSALMITTNQRPDEGANIATVAPDGSGLRFLTGYDPELGALAMSYSPDGQSILFRLTQVDPDTEPEEHLHALALVPTDGGGVEQLTDFSVTWPGLDGVAFETGHYPRFDWGTAPTASQGAGPLPAVLSSAAPAADSSAAPTAEAAAWNYVALGDSWPEGAHCGGCRTFVDLWADALGASRGRKIVLTDFTGSQEPGLAPGSGETSTSLLASLRFNPVMRDAIRSADIILISSGGNEIGLPDDPPAGGDCSEDAVFECISALGRMWSTNHDAVLDEIELLRAGMPTAIRFVNDANLFLSDPGLAGVGSEEDIAKMDLVFQALTDAMCGVAAAHGAACVDVRPIINGPTMDVPGDENANSTMQDIADALMATGLPELE